MEDRRCGWCWFGEEKKMKTGRGLFGFGVEGRGFVWLRVQALDFLVEREEDGGKNVPELMRASCCILMTVRGSVCGRLETRKRRPTGGAELLIFSRKRGIK